MKRKILQISPYPPPWTGWGVRVQFLKKHLEARGHECSVLNIGSNRRVPSDEYETVLSGWDYVRKVWRFARRGFLVHMHVNGASWKGLVRQPTSSCSDSVWSRTSGIRPRQAPLKRSRSRSRSTKVSAGCRLR